MVALNFNAAGVKPNVALEAVPSGIYPVMISSSKEKPTKDGQGSYIELEMTVMPGHEYAGRKVYDRLNINNKNQQTVDIAYATLSAICHVTGRLAINATEQLHGVPFQAVVVKVARDDKPDVLTNNIRGYKDMQGNDPGAAGAAAQPTSQPNWAQNGQVQQQTQPVQQTQPAQQVQQPVQQTQTGGVQTQVQQEQPNWAQNPPAQVAGAANPPWQQQ